MSDVVTLYGHAVAVPYEPVPSTVELLEDLLERAKSGDIKGVHAVVVHGDDTATFASSLMASYRAVGAAFSMATEMASEINKQEE